MPVVVTGQWGSDRYTTRIRGFDEEYFVWHYLFTFTADVPLRAIFMVSQREETSWERSVGARQDIHGSPEKSLQARLKFFHSAWTEADEIRHSLHPPTLHCGQ